MFTVRAIPQPQDDGGGKFARVFLEKTLDGDLKGSSSTGHMLGVQLPAQGYGGYVALELVSGTLDGRRGTFVLQHSGSMTADAMTMKAAAIPGSGTDELVGLAGTFTIDIVSGEHRYKFDYTLPQ